MGVFLIEDIMDQKNVNCLLCGKLINRKIRQRSNYCSEGCCVKSYKSNRTAVFHPLGNAGTIGELFVANHFLHLDYECFRSLSPHSKTDLVIKRGRNMLAIEVKTYHYPKNKEVRPSKSIIKMNVFDFLALYIPEAQKILFFDCNLNSVSEKEIDERISV